MHGVQDAVYPQTGRTRLHLTKLIVTAHNHVAIAEPQRRTTWRAEMSVEIEVFRTEHAGRFADLNRAWLESFGLMEPAEDEQLADPQKYFVDGGGQIFVAVHLGDVIGTCAVLPHGRDEFELAKLTVSPDYRGQGIARRLVEHCLVYAREHGARRVMLVSNSRLQGALRLYESMGFRYCPLPEGVQYEVADVSMFLTIEPARDMAGH